MSFRLIPKPWGRRDLHAQSDIKGAAAFIEKSEKQQIKCLLIWQHPSGLLK